MFITMKLLEDVMFPELSLWTSNQELWIPSELDHSVNYSDQITLFLDKLEQETTGLKGITPKELNLLIQYSMLSEKKPKVVTVSKDFKLLILSEEELDLVWELF